MAKANKIFVIALSIAVILFIFTKKIDSKKENILQGGENRVNLTIKAIKKPAIGLGGGKDEENDNIHDSVYFIFYSQERKFKGVKPKKYTLQNIKYKGIVFTWHDN